MGHGASGCWRQRQVRRTRSDDQDIAVEIEGEAAVKAETIKHDPVVIVAVAIIIALFAVGIGKAFVIALTAFDVVTGR